MQQRTLSHPPILESLRCDINHLKSYWLDIMRRLKHKTYDLDSGAIQCVLNTRGGRQRSLIEPLSFNTLHFLRTYNRIFAPTDLPQCYNLTVLKDICPERRIASLPLTIYPGIGASNAKDISLGVPPIILASTSKCPLPSPVDTQCIYESSSSVDSNIPHGLGRRQRGEKRPIPDEQKDEKYYERRKRNNEAAKKSRDARKLREDRIAFRAAILEQENAILRAQNLNLREEIATLRQIVCPSSGNQTQITTITA